MPVIQFFSIQSISYLLSVHLNLTEQGHQHICYLETAVITAHLLCQLVRHCYGFQLPQFIVKHSYY